MNKMCCTYTKYRITTKHKYSHAIPHEKGFLTFLLRLALTPTGEYLENSKSIALRHTKLFYLGVNYVIQLIG